ncbi:sorting nexin-5 isoform X3 [Strongylocentrotus purpuratus]|uniref:PX domain-containing protein n=1 Tax=Strongylocentrotus purpuratus TaxID=7668 RepID=A0A7M7MYA3_STRPU|nr:sorting nexin-5 isoform X3 [Strongylocentrotus purpuratus]
MDKAVAENGDGPSATPFDPWYQVNVCDATKNGEAIIFKIKTLKLEEDGTEVTVERVYDDFEWLQHCLTTDNDIGGIIVPPLPPRPVSSAADTAAKSRKELGEESTKVKVGDEFHKDCRHLEKYLSLVIKHSTLGKDETLAKFLTAIDPPIRAKVKRGLFSNLTQKMSEVMKGGHQDTDNGFQHERDRANQVLPIMRDLSHVFKLRTNHLQRLSAALNHFATALCLVSSAEKEERLIEGTQIQLFFARAMEHYSHGIDVFTANHEVTLGFFLDVYARYAEAEKEMLHRRTLKLVEFDSAVKTLNKANPQKRAVAEENREKKEKDFNDISSIAKKELQVYNHQRVIEFQKSLVLYAEANIKTARDMYALLAKDLSEIKHTTL